MIDGPPASRLVLLPGMGADHTMYAGVWRSLPGVCFVDWPEYRGERTLGDVAERVIEHHGITSADEIGGTSLGGMVALEIARRLGQPQVLSLSGMLSPREVVPWLRLISPLSFYFPFEIPLAVMRMLPGAFLTPFRASAVMLRRTNPSFLRAMCAAIIRWEGCDPPPGGVVRLHGDRDWMIRCPPDAHKIAGAGHLAVLTHREECVQLVRSQWLGRRSADSSGVTRRV